MTAIITNRIAFTRDSGSIEFSMEQNPGGIRFVRLEMRDPNRTVYAKIPVEEWAAIVAWLDGEGAVDARSKKK